MPDQPVLPAGFRSSIVDTIEFLGRHREACLQRAMKSTGQEREDLIEAASRLGHAGLLLRRAYPWATVSDRKESPDAT